MTARPGIALTLPAPRALVVATSPFHLEMAATLRRVARSVEVIAGAAARLEAAGAQRLPDVFALRGADRLTGRRARAAAARAVLDEVRPDVVVVGNDMAPTERALIHESRRRELPVVLLQDGLFPAWQGDRWRRRIGRAIVRSGNPDLAPTLYGIGEATYVGLLGPAWIDPLARGRGPAPLHARAVGNIVFADTVRAVSTRDATAWRARIGLADSPTAVFFTTDLLRGLGAMSSVRHLRQARVIRDVASTWGAAGWSVKVRLHPAERPDDYAELIPGAVILDPTVPLAAAIGAADIGLVSGSAVSLILAATGRAVGWPVHDDAMTDERAAARWLGIPILSSVGETVVPPIAASRLVELLADDADDPLGSKSLRLIEEAARLH